MSFTRVTTVHLWLLFANISGLFQTVSGAKSGDLMSWPKDQTVKLGSKVSLECSVDSKVETNVDWLHNGNKIADWEDEWHQTSLTGQGLSVNTISVHVLTFSAMVEPVKTTGLYSCRVWNSLGSWSSKNATISISTNENFVKVPEDKTILWGEIATLSCELKTTFQRGSSTKWYHNERLIDISSDSRISSDQFGLQITNTEPRDEGSYYCVASKPGTGNFTSSNGSIKVVYPPRVDSNGLTKMTGFVSQSVELSCPMIGVPQVLCYWSRVGNQDIPATRAIQTDNRLVIGHVQSSDEGEYLCQCSNKYGENRVIVKLEVPTFLEFASKPVDTVALVGHKAEVPCLVKSTAGNEQGVVIVWEIKEQMQLIFQEEKLGNKEVLKNGTLLIHNVTNDDRGYYICKALQPTANAQQIHETVFIEVRSHSNMRPPIITIAPFNHTMRPGGKLRLPCAASSESAVTITWRFQNAAWAAALAGNIRSTDQRISTEENGALTVSDVRYEDNGLYKCIASTAAGTTERYAVITVKKDGLEKSPDPSLLPLAVGKPVITRITEDAISLKWDPGENESPEYVVEMYSYETHVFAWTPVGTGIYSNVLTVGSLAPNQDYEFLVRGVNKLGVGLPSPVSSRVRTVERKPDADLTGVRDADIESQIDLVEVEALEGTAINSTAAWIQWNVLYNSYFVKGFIIKYTEHDGGNIHKVPNYNSVKVNDPYTRSLLVTGLKPWSSYMASVQPFYDSVLGIDSQHIFFTTPEGTPQDVVSKVKLHQMTGGRYMVTWQAPAKQREGQIIGYSVSLYFGESEVPLQTLNTTDTQCTFTAVDNDEDFRVSIAARTRAGVGVFSPLISPKDMAVEKESSSWIIEHPWVLAILGALVWVTLAAVSVLIWKRQRRGHYKSVRAVKLEQSLQPPAAEYAGGQWQVILPASAQSSRMPAQYLAHSGPSGSMIPSQNEANFFMGANTIPVSMGNNSNYAGHPECYQPLMVELSGVRSANEGLYQCGDCYEECNPFQCNNATAHSSNLPAATSCASCHCANHNNPDSLGPPGCSSSPESQSHCHPGAVSPKFSANPNKYQHTPPRRSSEHLYNELDPKLISGQHSPTCGHHYEVYDSDLMQNNHRHLNNPGHSGRQYGEQDFSINPNAQPFQTTPSRHMPHPFSVAPQTGNMPVPSHNLPATPGKEMSSQQGVMAAPPLQCQQIPPSVPAPRSSCPRMGLSGVRAGSSSQFSTPTNAPNPNTNHMQLMQTNSHNAANMHLQ